MTVKAGSSIMSLNEIINDDDDDLLFWSPVFQVVH